MDKSTKTMISDDVMELQKLFYQTYNYLDNDKKNKLLILGIGNYLMGDEGVGVHAIHALSKVPLPDYVDIMDGHFVPNMTIGPVVIDAVSKVATKPLDIHIMVEDNNFFIDLLAPFKPEYLTFHYESEKHHNRIIQKLRNLGIKPSISINPGTNIDLLEYMIEDLDMVLLMSVNPGFGGQKFIPNVLEKAKKLKEIIERKNPNCLIEVDGGVSDKNINLLKEAGVDVVVAGSYVFKNNYKKAIESLKI